MISPPTPSVLTNKKSHKKKTSCGLYSTSKYDYETATSLVPVLDVWPSQYHASRRLDQYLRHLD
jgi:hypothetical protein